MNPFALTCAALQAGASFYEVWRSDWPMATVWGCFAISGAVLATMVRSS